MLNIGILVHMFHLEQWQSHCRYINNIRNTFDNTTVIFTLKKDDESKLFAEDVINKEFPESHKIYVENKGTDVLPFFQKIRYARERGIHLDYIFKLHTKASNNSVEGLDNWSKQLIEPLVKPTNLQVIKHIFETTSVGYVASQSCVLPRNYDLDFPTNLRGIERVCRTFPFSCTGGQYVNFIGGNIFWINNKLLDKRLTEPLMCFLEAGFTEGGRPPCNLTSKEIHYEYVCERLFTGVFCYDSTNVLVNDFDGTARGIDEGINYFYQPKVFSFHKQGEQR